MTFRFGPNHKNKGRISGMSPTLRKAFAPQRNISFASYPIKTKENAIKLINNLSNFFGERPPSCPTTKSLSPKNVNNFKKTYNVPTLTLPKFGSSKFKTTTISPGSTTKSRSPSGSLNRSPNKSKRPSRSLNRSPSKSKSPSRSRSRSRRS